MCSSDLHEVAVMYLGRIVEAGAVGEVLKAPQHPYTQALLSAVPVIDAATKRASIRLKGDLPSPVNPPAGCFFHPRCSSALPACASEYPAAASLSATRSLNCHLFDAGKK